MTRKPDRGKIARQQAKNVRKSNPGDQEAEKLAKKIDDAATWEDTVSEEGGGS